MSDEESEERDSEQEEEDEEDAEEKSDENSEDEENIEENEEDLNDIPKQKEEPIVINKTPRSAIGNIMDDLDDLSFDLYRSFPNFGMNK